MHDLRDLRMKCRITTLAAAGVLLPAILHAQDLTKTTTSAPVNLPYKVICHNLATVPLTADAMQALPLKVVASLNCGDGLQPLSDVDSYTIKVRTADGKVGYIASMYLMKAPPAKPAPRAAAPTSAPTNNGVARWRAGAKGCDQFVKDGVTVESLSANGVTVQVSLRDDGSKLRAGVAIGNFSNLHVYVDPAGITLETRRGRSLLSRDASQVAAEAQSTAAAGNANGNAPAANAADNAATDFSPVFASVNSSDKQPVEDLSRPVVKKAATVADQLNAEALKKGAVKPDGRTWGAVWFDRDANGTQYVMRVPIDDQIFEFPLSIEAAASTSTAVSDSSTSPAANPQR